MATITLTLLAEQTIAGINTRFTMTLTRGTRYLATRTGDRNAVIGFYRNARTAAAQNGHALTVSDETGDFILAQDGDSTIDLKIATRPAPGTDIDAADYMHVATGGTLSPLTGKAA